MLEKKQFGVESKRMAIVVAIVIWLRIKSGSPKSKYGSQGQVGGNPLAMGEAGAAAAPATTAAPV